MGLSMLRPPRGRSCHDPIFCLMDESGQQGHILIEVDDLATHGNAIHVENMAKL